MKIGGKKISGPNVTTVVFPRGDNDEDTLVFKIQAVLDMKDFEELCPLPEPPTIVKKDQSKSKDFNDAKYLAKIAKHNSLRFTYTVLKSLMATPGLEWETVKMNEPSTWENYDQDLKDAGISQAERNHLLMAVLDTNSVSEDRLKEARDHFLRSQAKRAEESSFQKDEPSTTESGEPASVSESDRQV